MSEAARAGAAPGEQAAPAPCAAPPRALRLAERLRRVVELAGRWGSWLVLPVVAITSLDVVMRKMKYVTSEGQVYSLQFWVRENVGRFLDSTVLQELEWHFHTALFALVLGYGVVYNTHVRIDLIRENLEFRKKAWLEFIGLTFFMIPYCAIVIWFAVGYVASSFAIGEGSVSTVGLSHRWIIKSVLVIGLVVALISGIAAWLQVCTILWGPQGLRFPLMTLDWEKLVRRYVWNDEKTPYLTRVEHLSVRQAQYELFGGALFTGVFFGVLAVATLAPGLPHGNAPIVPLYAFSVCCAAVVLGITRHPWAALWCALAPLGLLAYFAAWGFHTALETADKALLVAAVLAWLAYGRRLVAVARAWQRLAGGS